jgi:hypothetical protein
MFSVIIAYVLPNEAAFYNQYLLGVRILPL